MNFQQFFEALAQDGIDYVLVGGLAVSLHGVVRGTMDVDIAMSMDDANVVRFIALARRTGLNPSIPASIDELGNAAQLDRWFQDKGMIAFSLRESAPAGLVVDVLVRPRVAFETLRARSITKPFGAVGIRIASIADLIELKTGTGRSIDAFDIAQLSQLDREGHE